MATIPADNAPNARSTPTALTTWLTRLRFVVAVALLWGALYVVLDKFLLPVGDHRPPTLLVGFGGIVPALATFAVVLGGAALAAYLVPRRDPVTVVVVVGFALAGWAANRGTIDDWLILRNPQPGPATGAAYAPLLIEYLGLAALLLGVLVLSEALRPRPANGPPRTAWSGLFQRVGDGPIALLVTAAVAAVLLFIIAGPAAAETRRGQVYFAVFLAFTIGTVIARRFSRTADYVWYWGAPLLVGLAGVVFAMLQPGRFLGADYTNLNLLPAFSLVRPLPIEMVSVGLVGIGWGLSLSHPEPRPAAA